MKAILSVFAALIFAGLCSTASAARPNCWQDPVNGTVCCDYQNGVVVCKPIISVPGIPPIINLPNVPGIIG